MLRMVKLICLKKKSILNIEHRQAAEIHGMLTDFLAAKKLPIPLSMRILTD